MIKLYAWNVGWVMRLRKDGKIVYTNNKDGAKPYPSEYDEEFETVARMIEYKGHHLDKVQCNDTSATIISRKR